MLRLGIEALLAAAAKLHRQSGSLPGRSSFDQVLRGHDSHLTNLSALAYAPLRTDVLLRRRYASEATPPIEPHEERYITLNNIHDNCGARKKVCFAMLCCYSLIQCTMCHEREQTMQR